MSAMAVAESMASILGCRGAGRGQGKTQSLATGQTQAKADKLAAFRSRTVRRRQDMATGGRRKRRLTTKAQRTRRQHKGERGGALGALSKLGGEATVSCHY